MKSRVLIRYARQALQVKGVAPEHVIGVWGEAYIVGPERPILRSLVSLALLSTAWSYDSMHLKSVDTGPVCYCLSTS